MRSSPIAALAAVILACATAQAHGPAGPGRYRLEEVMPPPAAAAACLAEFGETLSGNDVNDFGIVDGTHSCFTQVDPAAVALHQEFTPYVWALRFGGLALQDSGGPNDLAFAISLNDRGEVFGGEGRDSGLFGVKWSLAGGFETIFETPQCDGFNINLAIAGNARHAIGWSALPDTDLPPPFDTVCLTSRWVTRTAAGNLILGPKRGNPTDMNALSVAVGTQDDDAIRYIVATGATRLLRAGDSTSTAFPTDINDLGEVAGYVTDISGGGQVGCGPSIALRWGRDDRETRLPHLPGAVSSVASGVGYDGETVGNSGPGEYCDPVLSTRERATLWLGGRAFDLNRLVVGAPRVTLNWAVSVNRRGQIVAAGFRTDEALRICPKFALDPQTGLTTVDLTQRCIHQRLYLLTPL